MRYALDSPEALAVIEAHEEQENIRRAAREAGVSFDAAKRILLEVGLITEKEQTLEGRVKQLEALLGSREAASPRVVPDSTALVDKIRKKPMTLAEIASAGGFGEADAREWISHQVSEGLNLRDFGGRYEVAKQVPSASIGSPIMEVLSDDDDTFTLGALGDSHLCSKYERLDVLNDLYDRYEREGVRDVFHTGNWIDGEARFNKHDIHVYGMDNQLRYLARNYPHKPGINTYAVAGDDHEGWYCFDDQAEIMSRSRGWVKFADLGDDEVATRSDDGRFEWQKPIAKVSYAYDGPMVRVQARSLDFRVTPEHRLLTQVRPSLHGPETTRVLTASEMKEGFKSRCVGIVCGSEGWEGERLEFVEIPRIDPEHRVNDPRIQHFGQMAIADVAELIAWYVTEGSTYNGTASIAQSSTVNAENCTRIDSLLARTGARFSQSPSYFRICSPELVAFLTSNCGKGFKNVRLPQWLKDQPTDILKIVFNTMIEGDGSFKKHGWRFYSWSKGLRDDMAEISQKLGYPAVENAKHNSLSIRGAHVDPWLVDAPTTEHYEGHVYCVTVPNDRIYVRCNGKPFWSMNCQNTGINIGQHAANMMRKEGRHDWHDLGYMEAFVKLTNRNSGASAMLHVIHPGGGSAYALSYTVQKIVESYGGGEKPAAAFVGHYHKMELANIRNVWTVQTGTQMGQSPFMRKKRLEAHVGGHVIRFRQDRKSGALVEMNGMLRYFNVGFYNNQWSHSGPVTQPKRTLGGVA